ncbi:hypothetical protein [Nocardia brasiliensis]|uniref:hypothetical protein n=1 Tax=Nocardia brasiliensis TaxID=37326 RepID=UPI003671BF0A
MRIRATVATLGIATGLATVTASFGAGQAAAFTAMIDTDNGSYSVALNHSETVALRDSPLPGMLNPVWRDHGTAFVIPFSTYFEDEDEGATTDVRADLSDVIAETAASEDGIVLLSIVNPADPYGLPDGRSLLAVGFPH